MPTTHPPSDAPQCVRLGDALSDRDLEGLARATLRAPSAALGDWHLEPVDYPYGSPTTGGLFRILGTAATDDRVLRWSAFVKVIHSYRHWPMIDVVPEPLRQAALSGRHWRYEADVYLSDVAAVLPPGIRLPQVHLVEDLGEERIAVVLEDVDTAPAPWTTSTYARAAHLLARLGVRLTRTDALPATASRVPGEATARHVTSRVVPAVLPVLLDDRTWHHPLLRGQHALRRDALALAERLPSILERLTLLPQLMTHGDASPQNLLVPAADERTFVAVDWTLGGLSAVGDDLGQLLLGLAHAHLLPVDALPGLRDTVIDAYLDGLTAEDVHIGREVVRQGLDGGVAARSALTTLPLERLGEPVSDELEAVFRRRVELTRYLLDLALALPERPPDPLTDRPLGGAR